MTEQLESFQRLWEVSFLAGKALKKWRMFGGSLKGCSVTHENSIKLLVPVSVVIITELGKTSAECPIKTFCEPVHLQENKLIITSKYIHCRA